MTVFGSLIKFGEVVALAVYFSNVIDGVGHYSLFHWVRTPDTIERGTFEQMKKIMYPTTFANYTILSLHSEKALDILIPDFFIDTNKVDQWAGGSFIWFRMELIVFGYYGLTMIILLMKSRIFKIGADLSQ